MDFDRRTFGRLAAAAAGAALAPGAFAATVRRKPNSVVNGVRLGIQPFSYHDLAMNDGNRPLLIDAMVQDDISICELHAAWVQPYMGNDEQKIWNWIKSAPPSYYEKVRKEFDAAGIEIYQYNINHGRINLRTPPEVIDKLFEAAKILGAKGVTGSYGLAVAHSLAPFPEKHGGMFVGLHGHDNKSDPDAFSTEETFIKGLSYSPRFMCTWDLRHFTAADGDVMGFLERHHDRISSIHLGERRKDNGHSVPFGEGDSHVIEVLRTIRDNKWPITCLLEFEHGTLLTGIEEVRIQLNYCKRALA